MAALTSSATSIIPPPSLANVVVLRLRDEMGNTLGIMPNLSHFQAELALFHQVANPRGGLNLAGIDALPNALKGCMQNASSPAALLAKPEAAQKLRLEWVSTPILGLLTRIQQLKGSAEDASALIDLLEAGLVRTAEKVAGIWCPQAYAIQGILNYFATQEMRIMERGGWDKVPLKTSAMAADDFNREGVRYVPGAIVRKGCYIGPGSVLMSHAFVNIGAYIAGDGVMVDVAARVASAAQVGKGVKLGAGTGIEGVLEPAGRMPSIIEDGAKIGAMCETSGIVGEGSVLASGVVMASGKRIYDEETGKVLNPLEVHVEGKTYLLPVIPPYRLAVGGGLPAKDGRTITDAVILKPGDLREGNTLKHFERQGLLYQ